MDLEILRNKMNLILSETRYRHCLGVEEVSCDLAYIYGYDAEKASVAGILHDCAKHLSEEQLIEACQKYHIIVTEIEADNTFLLHAKVGAACAKEMYGVEDEDIINTIIYHTTGRPAMSLLEKIVFTADYIEPYREPYPKIDEIRRIAYENLDLAVYMILKNTLEYLNETGVVIDTLTNKTYEYYKTIIHTVMN